MENKKIIKIILDYLNKKTSLFELKEEIQKIESTYENNLMQQLNTNDEENSELITRGILRQLVVDNKLNIGNAKDRDLEWTQDIFIDFEEPASKLSKTIEKYENEILGKPANNYPNSSVGLYRKLS